MLNSAIEKQCNIETESLSSSMTSQEAKRLPLSILEKLQSTENQGKSKLSSSTPNACTEAPQGDLDIDGNTPLHRAASEGNLDRVINLVANNANIFAKSRQQKTALHYAITKGNLEVLKCLLDALKEQNNLEACLQIKDLEGKTPLHRAASDQSKIEMVNLLLLYGADPNAKDNYGYTALHWAAKYGHTKIAELLVRYGVEVTSLNSNKETAFDLSLRFRRDAISRLFLGAIWQSENEVDCEDLEKFYYESLVRSRKEGLLEEQIFFLEKLGDIYSNRKDFLKAALIFNTALAISSNESLLEKYLLTKLDRLEEQFLENEKIKRPLGSKNNLFYYRKLLNDSREKCSNLYVANKKIYKAGLFEDEAIREVVMPTSQAHTMDKQRKNLERQKGHISTVFKTLNQGFRQLLEELILSAQENMGAPPCQWACIGMGSMAREEMCPYSDVEFAFLIEESNPQTLNYFRLLTKLVELKIINMGETSFTLFKDSPSITPNGYCMDTGGNTPYGNRDTYELIGTPGDLARFQNQRWIDENLILANAMGTVCLVAGNKTLFESYQNQKTENLNQKAWFLGPPLRQTFAIRMLEGHLNEFSPNLSRQKEKEDKAFGIKKELYRPLQETISCLALYYNLKSTNTLERIQELVKIGFFCFEGAYYLEYAIRQVLSLRVEAHLFYQDEKEFLCYIEVDKPQEEGLLYLDDNRTERIKRIYSILIPFCEALKLFCVTRKKRTVNQCVFYDNMHVQASNLSYGLKTEAAKDVFQQQVSLNPNDFHAINSLGHAEEILGNKEETLERAYQALAVIEATHKDQDSVRHFLVRTQFITIGKALFNLGKYLEALEYFQKVTDSRSIEEEEKEDRPSMSLLYARHYRFLGTCWEEIGIYAKALDYHVSSLGGYLGLRNDQNLNVATCYNNIAFSLSHLGEDKAAENYYDAALQILFKFYGEDHPLIAQIYMNKGAHLFGKGALFCLNKEIVLEYYNKALKIYSKIVGEGQSEDFKNLISNEVKIDSLAMSRSVEQLSRNQIATKLWLEKKAMISDTMLEKVNLAKRYLDVIGYELCGTVVDENSFLNAFVGSVQSLGIDDREAVPDSGELILQLKEVIADVSSNEEKEMPDWSTIDRSEVDRLIFDKMFTDENKLNYLTEEYKKSPNGIDQSDTQNQRWLFGCPKFTLLAKALHTPIRQLIINGNENGYSCMDMLTCAIGEMQRWDEIQESQRPETYVFIVDLTGHFLYARKRNLEIELEKSIPLISDKPEHTKIAEIYSRIGVLLNGNREYEEAIIYFNKALKIYLKFFGDGHINVAKTYDHIGTSLQCQKRYEASEEHLQKALKIYLSLSDDKNPKVAHLYKLIGISLRNQNKPDSLYYFQQALKVYLNVYGELHPLVAEIYNQIGLCLYFGNQGKDQEALNYYQKALVIYLKTCNEEHPDFLSTLENIRVISEAMATYKTP